MPKALKQSEQPDNLVTVAMQDLKGLLLDLMMQAEPSIMQTA